MTIQGVVIGGDGLNHAKDLDNAVTVKEEPVDMPDVDAITGETVDDSTVASDDTSTMDSTDATVDTVASDDSTTSDSDTADDSSSVVSQPKPAVNVSQPIVVVKRS